MVRLCCNGGGMGTHTGSTTLTLFSGMSVDEL